MSNSSELNFQQSLLLLVKSASENYKKNDQTNQHLSTVAESQNDLLEDITVSIPEVDLLQKKIEQVDKDLIEVDSMILQTNNALKEVLSSDQPKSRADPGPILSSILQTIQNTLFSIALDAAGHEQTDCSLLNIVDLENQVSKMIEKLVEQDMYPEDQQQLHNRVANVSQHNKKLVKFLQEIQQFQDD